MKKQSFIDASLESQARDVAEKTDVLKRKPTYPKLKALARELQMLKLEVLSHLAYYGREYERRGLTFIETATEALEASMLVPERMTNTEGGDRSAHALIERSVREIRTHVERTCGTHAIEQVAYTRIQTGLNTTTAS